MGMLRSAVLWSLTVVCCLGSIAEAAEPRAAEDAAQAITPSAPAVGFTVGTKYVSDYVFRGVSNSDRRGSAWTFLEAQYLNNFVYTGISTEEVRIPTRAAFEMDFSAGIRPTFDKFTFDLGIIYYNYPNERRVLTPFAQIGTLPLTTANSDFYEGAAKVLYSASDDWTFGLNFYHSPSWFGTHAVSSYLSGVAVNKLPPTFFPFLPEKHANAFLLSSEVGYFFLGAARNSATGPFDVETRRFPVLNLPSYLYANIGITYTWKNFLVDVRYHTTTLSKGQCFAFTGDLRGVYNGGTSRWCGDVIAGSITWQASTADPGIFADPAGFRNFLE